MGVVWRIIALIDEIVCLQVARYTKVYWDF